MSFCFSRLVGLARLMRKRRGATMLKMEQKKKKNKIHRIFDSNHFAIPTGAISEEQHIQRRICNLQPVVTSWSERRAQALEARMQGDTQLIDDWNRQVVACDQREFLRRDLFGLAGPGTFLPRFTQVVSGLDFTALFRPFWPSAVKPRVLLETPWKLLWIIILMECSCTAPSLLASLARVFQPQATEVGLVQSRPSGWQRGNPSQPKQTAEQAGSKREEIVFS